MVFHKNKEYTIRAEKEGCQPIIRKAEKVFDATTLLGIFIDYGIISILVIDGVATGAMHEFSQESYALTGFECS